MFSLNTLLVVLYSNSNAKPELVPKQIAENVLVKAQTNAHLAIKAFI